MNDLPKQCQCENAGFCQLLRRETDPHQGRFMSEVRHNECQNRPGWFEMFIGESIAGGKVQPERQPPKPGVGTVLKQLLFDRYRIQPDNCLCNERAAEMDSRGVEWCEQNLETVLDWLMEGAKDRKWLKHFVRLFPGTAREEARRLVLESIETSKLIEQQPASP